MIDFHTHILPGIDDGSGSVEESLAMLRLEAEQGIGCVAATPHFYPWNDTPGRFLERRARAEELLRRAAEQQTGLPKIVLGAEVSFFRGLSESEYLPQLTMAGEKYILLEMPAGPWDERTCRELEQIRSRGIVPVIAHIDRCIKPFAARAMRQQLAELPVLVQANADFFLNRLTASLAMRMLREEQIHLLGSDCHNMTDRMPNLGPALQRISRSLGQAAVERIRGFEQRILEPEE